MNEKKALSVPEILGAAELFFMPDYKLSKISSMVLPKTG